MLRLTAALLALLLGATPSALADACRAIEAELAAMSRDVGPRQRQIATRAAWDAQRLRAHMSAIGCDRRPFLFLGPQPPAECRGYAAQLGQLQAQARPAYPPDEARRRQLAAMLASNNCRAAPQRRSQPLTAGIFDDGERRRGELDSVEIEDAEPVEPRVAAPSGKPVCVRLCDGFFFPLHLRGPQLREDGDAACRELCPGAETKVYFTQGDIEQARSADGEAYSDLDHALRYRRTFDASCFCRRGEERREGGLILNPEGGGAPGFGVLNPDPAEEDAPLRGMTPAPGRKAGGPLFNREPKPPPAPPPAVETENVVPADQGETREVTGPDGVKRSVRVIALTPSRAPSAAAEPSAPVRGPGP